MTERTVAVLAFVVGLAASVGAPAVAKCGYPSLRQDLVLEASTGAPVPDEVTLTVDDGGTDLWFHLSGGGLSLWFDPIREAP